MRFATGPATPKLQLPWFERGLDVIGTARKADPVAKLVEVTAT